MSRLCLCVLLFCFWSINALPEFDDPVHGRLIMSRRRPLFLTNKNRPDRAYYMPTDDQAAEMRRAIKVVPRRYKRSSDGNSSRIETRLRISDPFELYPEDETGDLYGENAPNSIEMNDHEFNQSMATFRNYKIFVGRMISTIFAGYFNKPAIDGSLLPFEVTRETTQLKQIVIESTYLSDWLDIMERNLQNVFRNSESDSIFPVDNVVRELEMCAYVGNSDMSDKKFKFLTDDEGYMTYYKVHCMRVGTKLFILFAIRDNGFQMLPVEETVQRTTYSTVIERRCYYLCWIMVFKPVRIATDEWVEVRRKPTARQLNEFKEYMLDEIMQTVKLEYHGQMELARQYPHGRIRKFLL